MLPIFFVKTSIDSWRVKSYCTWWIRNSGFRPARPAGLRVADHDKIPLMDDSTLEVSALQLTCHLISWIAKNRILGATRRFVFPEVIDVDHYAP
jgi:hypothetical protein